MAKNLWQKHVWNKNTYGTTCSKCGRENHFAARCLVRNKNPRQQLKNVNVVKMIQILIADKINDKAVMAPMEVTGKIVQFLIDPGASVNILPR